MFVERKKIGRLGADPSAPFVVSRRNSLEKSPWKDLPGIENRVEAEFLRPVLLGESILPYRTFRPLEGVVPITADGKVLNAEAALARGCDGLHGWMSKSEAAWNSHRAAEITLIERFDYYGLLAAQFPTPPLRVVYAKAGTQPAATILRDAKYIIENLLYWCPVASEQEAWYLCAIINSETSRKRIEAFQARGQWGARHFDKVIFNLPIPRFDPKDKTHAALAKAASEAEKLAAAIELPEGVKFQRARGLVRSALVESGIAKRIDDLVARLLDG